MLPSSPRGHHKQALHQPKDQARLESAYLSYYTATTQDFKDPGWPLSLQ